jgi:hypothetical protein
MYLSSCCNKVCLIHRRDAFRGEQSLVDRLQAHSNIDFHLNTTVSGLNGGDELNSVSLKDVVSGAESDLKLDGLFVAVGYLPNTAPFRSAVELDEYGFVVAGEDCRTSAEGIFAAGDCRTKEVRQLTTAAADGVTGRLLVLLEHRLPSLSDTEKRWLAERFGPLVADGLQSVNSEYRRLSELSPALAAPEVRVFASGHGPFAADAGKLKRRYIA